MSNLDREIEQLERRLSHLRDLRDRRDERIYRMIDGAIAPATAIPPTTPKTLITSR